MAHEQWDVWNDQGGPKYPHEKVIQFTFRNFLKKDRNVTKVLDLGCGSGVHTKFFASEGFAVTGFDISKTGVYNTRRLIGKIDQNASLLIGSIEKLCFADNSFHHILSIGVLECVPPSIAIKVIKDTIRVLKPNGLALLIFSSNKGYHIMGPNPLGLHGYSEEEVERMIPKKGLSQLMKIILISKMIF